MFESRISRAEGFRCILAGVLLVLCVLLVGGCSDGDPERETQKTAPSSPKGTATSIKSPTNPLPDRERGVSIEFLPSPPTAENDLWALLKGATAQSWEWRRNGMPLEVPAEDHLLRRNFRKGDEITVIAGTDRGDFEASVVIGNSVPRITGVSLDNTGLRDGAGISAYPQAVDADEDSLSFEFVWRVNGAEVHEGGETLPRDAFREGDRVSLVVRVDDGEDVGSEYVGEDFVIPNAPPYFTTQPPTSFIDFSYAYRFRAADPDGDEVSYSLAEAPEGMKLADSDLLVWNIPADAGGVFRVRIMAKDDRGGVSTQEYDLRITPSAPESEPAQ